MPFAVCNKGTAPRTHALLKMFDAALPISSLPIARRIARRMPSLVTCNCIVTACAMPERPTHPLTAIAGMDSAPHVFLVTRNGRATACAMPERPTPPRPLPDGWHATSPRRVCGPAYPPSMPCWQGRSAPHPPASARKCTMHRPHPLPGRMARCAPSRRQRWPCTECRATLRAAPLCARRAYWGRPLSSSQHPSPPLLRDGRKRRGRPYPHRGRAPPYARYTILGNPRAIRRASRPPRPLAAAGRLQHLGPQRGPRG